MGWTVPPRLDGRGAHRDFKVRIRRAAGSATLYIAGHGAPAGSATPGDSRRAVPVAEATTAHGGEKPCYRGRPRRRRGPRPGCG